MGDILRSTNLNDRNLIFRMMLDAVKNYLHVLRLDLLLYREQDHGFELVADSGSREPLIHPRAQDLDGDILKALHANFSPIQKTKSDCSQTLDLNCPSAGLVVWVPLIHNKKVIGILRIWRDSEQHFDRNQISFFNLVADQMATASIIFRIYNQMLKEEKWRFNLSRFFSKSVASEILDHSKLNLGGERKKLTVMFADLKNFTFISENLEEETVVELLNRFFSEMIPIVFHYKGTLDKIMGDGLLAFFGAPKSYPDDALMGLKAATAMIQTLKKFNEKHKLKKWPTLRLAIGLNYGEALAGFIGAEDHLNYTVIGDTVNLAQRIQSLAGPDEIMISKELFDAIGNDLDKIEDIKEVIPLKPVKVKGRSKEVYLYKMICS